MKKQTIFFAAALLTAGALLTSCSNDDMTIENPTQQTAPGVMTFTATLAPKDGTATTRSVDADGVTTWQVDELIAVYYEKTDDTYGTATANVDAVNDGKATISASLTDAKDGGTVKFVYPATIVNATGDDIDAAKLATQHGTIADISANFDAATGSGTLVTNGTTCGTDGTVTLTNQVLIGKFTPKFSDAAIDEITTLTVTDGTNTYTVTPTSGTFGTTGIYVAMLPVDDKEVIVTAATATQSYGYGGKKITLAVGKLYDNLAIKMGKLVDVSTFTDQQHYVAQDGDVLTGTLYYTGHTAARQISIADGATVTLCNLNINGENNTSRKWAGLTCEGSATIILSGSNTVKSNMRYYPGINVPSGSTLTIRGCGSVTARCCDTGSTSWGAGIGGGYHNADANKFAIDCGNIRIEGGTVNAIGGRNAPGIGGVNTGSCGTITITSGVTRVTATKGSDATYSIGRGNSGSCGSITIGGTDYGTDGITTSPFTYPAP